jgi:hypothetical protein
MLVFVLFVTFGSSLTLAKGILFFLLGLIISGAAFYIVNLSIPKSWDDCWLVMTPFVGIMVLCSVILGWDVYLPFILCGFFALAMSASTKYIRKSGSKQQGDSAPELTFKSTFPLFKILGTSAASALMFVCICGFVEVLV